jgi:hypothetical protein
MALVNECVCGTNIGGNTGLPTCVELFDLASGLGFIAMKGADGVQNKLNLAVASMTTEFSSMLKNADYSKRLFPVTGMRNFAYPMSEVKYETDNVDEKEFVRDGVQSVTAEKWSVSNILVAKLKEGKCQENGGFIFTKKGVIGLRKADNYFYPIHLKALVNKYTFKEGDKVAKLMTSFDMDVLTKVGEFYLVPWTELNMVYDDVIGLIDVNFKVVTAPAISGLNTLLNVRLTSDYSEGLIGNTQDVTGLVGADFAGYNKTTATVVTITSATEVIDDKYTIQYVTLPNVATNLMKVTIVTTSGFEGTYNFVQP